MDKGSTVLTPTVLTSYIDSINYDTFFLILTYFCDSFNSDTF